MDSSGIIKQMPVSIEAEQALLGSIIIKPDCFDQVGGMVNVDDFYLEEHRHIYTALLSMYSQSRTIDTVTLVNALVEQGDRDEAGGIQYITLLAESAPTASNAKDYAKIVKDKSTLRRLIKACEDIAASAYEEAAPVRTIVDAAEQKIFDIANNNDVKEFRHIKDVLKSVYHEIEVTSDSKGAVSGAKTGFSALDRMKFCQVRSFC